MHLCPATHMLIALSLRLPSSLSCRLSSSTGLRFYVAKERHPARLAIIIIIVIICCFSFVLLLFFVSTTIMHLLTNIYKYIYIYIYLIITIYLYICMIVDMCCNDEIPARLAQASISAGTPTWAAGRLPIIIIIIILTMLILLLL